MNFQHLSASSEILGGKPCITGTRISVAMLLEWLAAGAERDEILKAYPDISAEAFAEALQFAAQQAQNEILLDLNNAA